MHEAGTPWSALYETWGLRQPPLGDDPCPLGRYAVHGHRLADAPASCLRFKDIPPGVAATTNRRVRKAVTSVQQMRAFRLLLNSTKQTVIFLQLLVQPRPTGREAVPTRG